jgi:Pin2-interacting protein X1
MSQRYKEKVLSSSGISHKKFTSELGIKLLTKMGWKEGNGLGKNQHGRTECIQV